MITQVLHCPHCHETDIVRHGKTPQGKQRRTRGRIGRMIVFVANVVQLVRDGTYSVDELARAGKIKIRKGFSEQELTFTGSIPGEYLKATLEVTADQTADTVASSAMGRAAAEVHVKRGRDEDIENDKLWREKVLQHCPANAAAPGSLGGVHGLQLALPFV